MEKFEKNKNNKSGKGKMGKKIKKGAGMALKGILMTGILAAAPTETPAPGVKEKLKEEKKIEISDKAVQVKEKEVAAGISYVMAQKKIGEKEAEIKEKIRKAEVVSEFEKPKKAPKIEYKEKLKVVKLNPDNFAEKLKSFLQIDLEDSKIYLKDLNVFKKDNGLTIKMKLRTKGLLINFNIGLSGDLVNEGGTDLGLENIKIDAPRLMKSKIKAELSPYLSNIPNYLFAALENEYPETIDAMQIDKEGNLQIVLRPWEH